MPPPVPPPVPPPSRASRSRASCASRLLGMGGGSSSESSRSDWAFQMTQIGAGLWGCVAAMNASLKNEDTFGSSAVSVTSFIYTTVWSVQACEQMTDFADEKIRLQSKLERHQNAANTIAVFSKAETDAATNFAAGKMSYKLYKKLFKQCEQSIAEQQAILDANDPGRQPLGSAPFARQAALSAAPHHSDDRHDAVQFHR